MRTNGVHFETSKRRALSGKDVGTFSAGNANGAFYEIYIYIVHEEYKFN